MNRLSKCIYHILLEVYHVKFFDFVKSGFRPSHMN